MIEELDTETYLCVLSNEFRIYLFDKKNSKNLYKQQIKFNDKNKALDLNELDKFLEDNIFKIEKLAGYFIKEIFLIIENENISEINFGIRKKNYEKVINKKFLETIITDAKDLFRENYNNQKIMHILIIRYLENGNYHLYFDDNFKGDNLCVEFQFNFISNKYISEINNILGKYQIDISGCMDGNYIISQFEKSRIDFSEKIFKVQMGCNENEVKLIPKNIKTSGFFEKFFQFFS